MGRITGFDIEQEVSRVANAAVIPAMDETSDAMVAVARRVARVRTGRMRDGWEAIPAKRTGRTHVRGGIRNDVEYTLWQDKGTSTIAPNNMSGQAMDSEAPQLPGRIRSRL